MSALSRTGQTHAHVTWHGRGSTRPGNDRCGIRHEHACDIATADCLPQFPADRHARCSAGMEPLSQLPKATGRAVPGAKHVGVQRSTPLGRRKGHLLNSCACTALVHYNPTYFKFLVAARRS